MGIAPEITSTFTILAPQYDTDAGLTEMRFRSHLRSQMRPYMQSLRLCLIIKASCQQGLRAVRRLSLLSSRLNDQYADGASLGQTALDFPQPPPHQSSQLVLMVQNNLTAAPMRPLGCHTHSLLRSSRLVAELCPHLAKLIRLFAHGLLVPVDKWGLI